jgi:hypothetical protein
VSKYFAHLGKMYLDLDANHPVVTLALPLLDKSVAAETSQKNSFIPI